MTAIAKEHRIEEWVHRRGAFDLEQPLLVGILNITPDSFSERGGQQPSAEHALERAREMVAAGAKLIDVGGESTRPGAVPIEIEAEIERVVPVIRRLRAELPVPLSIDTRRARVARAALAEGADIVNDISALSDPQMAAAVAEAGAGLVLMHMQGVPQTMQLSPRYDDVVSEVREALEERIVRARAAGIGPERIVIDPGIGFGKTAAHNVELLANLEQLADVGRPLFLGVSRKAFLGQLIGGAPPAERATATAAACVAALFQGVRIFRVHDVGVVREALAVAEAIRIAHHPRA